MLYAATILMSAGIAIMQPALPPLVRQWLPQRVGFGTALYTNGLLVGETLPVMLTLPLVFPLVANSWRWQPCGLGRAAARDRAPRRWRSRRGRSRLPATAARARPRWWPDWSNKLIWQLGFLLGSVNSVYFGSNAFLPGYLTDAGRPDLISAALTALNFGQLPASFALLAIAGRLERRAWPFVACGGGDAPVPRRHRDHRELVDGAFRRRARLRRRRDPHARACAAAAAERARRRGAHVGRACSPSATARGCSSRS